MGDDTESTHARSRERAVETPSVPFPILLNRKIVREIRIRNTRWSEVENFFFAGVLLVVWSFYVLWTNFFVVNDFLDLKRDFVLDERIDRR